MVAATKASVSLRTSTAFACHHDACAAWKQDEMNCSLENSIEIYLTLFTYFMCRFGVGTSPLRVVPLIVEYKLKPLSDRQTSRQPNKSRSVAMTSDKYSHCYEHNKAECSRFLTGGSSRYRNFFVESYGANTSKWSKAIPAKFYAIQKCIES